MRFRAAETVDAIVISHMHADHFIDVIPLRYALRYGARENERRVALYLPPGGEAVLRGVVAPFSGEEGAFLDDVFEIVTYDPARPLAIGDVTVTFAPTTHYIACFAMRFEAAGLSLVYSADTAPDTTIAAFARDATALVCEATLSRDEERVEPRGHLSAREAGTLAAHARVSALLLSHYPATADAAAMARDAATSYAGTIRVVDDANRYALEDFR